MAKTSTSPAHTPGPWTLEENDDMDFAIELRADSGSKHLAYIASMTEASEDDYDTAEDCEANVEECSANARLIAAAPDLLDLARTFWLVCDGRLGLLKDDEKDWRGDNEWRDMVGHFTALRKKCERVIAKVEGHSRRHAA